MLSGRYDRAGLCEQTKSPYDRVRVAWCFCIVGLYLSTCVCVDRARMLTALRRLASRRHDDDDDATSQTASVDAARSGTIKLWLIFRVRTENECVLPVACVPQ